MATAGSVSIEFRTKCVDVDGVFLVVEGDDFLNTSSCLMYGQKYYFRVYRSGGSVSTTSSAGFISLVGSQYSRLLADTVSFADTNEANLSKYIGTIQSHTWYGRDLGNILKTGNTSIKSTISGVGVAHISYMTKYDLYSITLSTQSYDTFPILIYVEAIEST